MNYADIMQCDGRYPNGPQPSFGAGFEVAGIIDAVDIHATGWKAGDAVMAFCRNGYSECVTSKNVPTVSSVERPATTGSWRDSISWDTPRTWKPWAMRSETSRNGWLRGKLTVIVRHTFPMEQATKAQRHIYDRKTVGKVVLTTG